MNYKEIENVKAIMQSVSNSKTAEIDDCKGCASVEECKKGAEDIKLAAANVAASIEKYIEEVKGNVVPCIKKGGN